MNFRMHAIAEALSAESITQSVVTIHNYLAERTRDYHRQTRTHGDGNADVFLDDIENCQRLLRKLSEALPEVNCSYQDRYDEDDEE